MAELLEVTSIFPINFMKTVNAALNILEAFLRQDSELGLMELARGTELKPSTAHRLVNTLVKRDYLSQQQKGEKYSLSLKLLPFSNVIKKRMKVRNVAFPFLVELNTSVNEAVNLAVLDKGVARDDEEMELGVKCVAVPVRDGEGNVVAAMSVSGPSTRLNSQRVKELESLVRSCGLKISQTLGYAGE